VPGTGCCLDFGNFEHPIRNEAILALVPHTVHIHAKSYAFDSQGNETTLPYPRFMRALSHVNYDGWFVIEYEGHQEPVSGIEQTRSLLTRLRF
ncbi:MAG: sugar phosphate isomerase/epimerase family protein, partial [Ardenticatenaceae bacterium]